MYLKLVLAACFLAFCAGVFSAYARLSDAGLGCANWPACYEENALKEKQLSQADASRNHSSWKWRLQNITGMILGMLSIAICSIAWQKRRELRQSPLLPTMLLALIAFLGAFGIWAFSHLPRSVIVPVHLAGGSAMLILLTWIALHQIKYSEISAGVILRWSRFSRLAFVMVLAQTLQGAWLSSNFAALACTDLPLCNGLLLPAMDFSFSLERYGPPLSVEQLVSIHWIHRVGALLVLLYLGWLSIMMMAVEGLRAIGKTLLGLLAFQFVLGISSVALGLPLAIAVLHNATAMLLLVVLTVLNFRLRIGEKKKI
mgnify:CR=1 FL=1